MKPLGLCQPKDEGNALSPCPVSPKDIDPSSVINQQNSMEINFLLNKPDGQDEDDTKEVFRKTQSKHVNGLCNGFMNSHHTPSDYANDSVSSLSPLSITVSESKLECLDNKSMEKSPSSNSLSPRVNKAIKRPSLECLVARLHHRVVDNKYNTNNLVVSSVNENFHTSEINYTDKRPQYLDNEMSHFRDSENCNSLNIDTSGSSTDSPICKENLNIGRTSVRSCSKIAQEEILDEKIDCKRCVNNGNDCLCYIKCFGTKNNLNKDESSFSHVNSSEVLPDASEDSSTSVVQETRESSLLVSLKSTDDIKKCNNKNSDDFSTISECELSKGAIEDDSINFNQKLTNKNNLETISDLSENISKCLDILANEVENSEEPKEKISNIENSRVSDINNEKCEGFNSKLTTSVSCEGFDSKLTTSVSCEGFDSKLTTSVSCEGFDSKLTTSASTTPLFSDTPSDASQSEMMVKISDAVAALLSSSSKHASPESSLDTRLKDNTDKLFSDSNSPAESIQSNINFSCAFKILDLLPESNYENGPVKPASSISEGKEESLPYESTAEENLNQIWSNNKRELVCENDTDKPTFLVNNGDKLIVNNNNYTEEKKASFSHCSEVATFNKNIILDEVKEAGEISTANYCLSLNEKIIETEFDVRKNGVTNMTLAKTIMCSNSKIDANDLIRPVVDSVSCEQNINIDLHSSVKAATNFKNIIENEIVEESETSSKAETDLDLSCKLSSVLPPGKITSQEDKLHNEKCEEDILQSKKCEVNILNSEKCEEDILDIEKCELDSEKCEKDILDIEKCELDSEKCEKDILNSRKCEEDKLSNVRSLTVYNNNELLNCKKYLNFILNKGCNYFNSKFRESQLNFQFLEASQMVTSSLTIDEEFNTERSSLNSSLILIEKDHLEAEIVSNSSTVSKVDDIELIELSVKNLPDINCNKANTENGTLSISPEELAEDIKVSKLDKKLIEPTSDCENTDNGSIGEGVISIPNSDMPLNNQTDRTVTKTEETTYSFVNFLKKDRSLISEVCILCNSFYEDLTYHSAQTHSCITYIPIYQTAAFIHHMRERTGNVEHSYSDEDYGNPYYICKCCGILLKSMNSVRVHLNIHKDIFLVQSSSYNCMCTKQSFSYPPNKWKSLLLKSEFACSFCNIYFSCEKGLYFHLQILHFLKNVCPKCNEMVKYEDKESVIEHNNNHVEIRDISDNIVPDFEESIEHVWDQTHFSWKSLDNHLNYIDGKSFRLRSLNSSNNADNDRENITLPLKTDPDFAVLPDNLGISPMVEMVKYTKSKLDSKLTGSNVDSYASKELEMNIQFLLHKKHSRKLKKKHISSNRKNITVPLSLELIPVFKKRNYIPVGLEDEEETPRRCKYARKAKTKVEKKRTLKGKDLKEEEEDMTLLSRTRSGMKSKDPSEMNTEMAELSSLPETEITGEWVNTHTFVCCSCGAVFLDLAEIMDHKWEAHPGVWCAHTMIQGQEKVPKMFYEQYLPSHSRGYQVSKVKEATKENYVCLKCKMKFTNREHFHFHIVDCGGLNQIVISKKKNKKGLRFKRRKGQLPSRRYSNSVVHTPHKVSSERASGTSTPNKDNGGNGSSKNLSATVKRKLSLATGAIENAELKSKLKSILSRRNKLKKKGSLSSPSKKSIQLRLRKRVEKAQQQQPQRLRETRNSKSDVNEKNKRARVKRKSQLQLLKEAQTFQENPEQISGKTERRVQKLTKRNVTKTRRRKSVEIVDVDVDNDVNLIGTRRKSVDVEQEEHDVEVIHEPKKTRRKSMEIMDVEQERDVYAQGSSKKRRQSIEGADVDEEKHYNLMAKKSSQKCIRQIKRLVSSNKNKSKSLLQKLPVEDATNKTVAKVENHKMKKIKRNFNLINKIRGVVLSRKNKKNALRKELEDTIELPESPSVVETNPGTVITNVSNVSKVKDSKKVGDDSDSSSEPEIIRNFRQKRCTGRSGLRSRKVFKPRYSLRPSLGADNGEGSDEEDLILKPRGSKRKYNIDDDESDEFSKKGENLLHKNPSSVKSNTNERETEVISDTFVGNRRRKSVTLNEEVEGISVPTEKNIEEVSKSEKSKPNRRKAYHTFKNQNAKISRFYYMAQKKFSRLKMSCQKRISESSSGNDELGQIPVKKRRVSTNGSSTKFFPDKDHLLKIESNAKSTNVESKFKVANAVESAVVKSTIIDAVKVKSSNVGSSKVRSLSVDSSDIVESAVVGCSKFKSKKHSTKLAKSAIKKRRCSDPLPASSSPNRNDINSQNVKLNENGIKHKRKYIRKCTKSKKKIFLTPEIVVDSDTESVSDVPLSSRKQKKQTTSLRSSDKINSNRSSIESITNREDQIEIAAVGKEDTEMQKRKRKQGQKGIMRKRSKASIHEEKSPTEVCTSDVVGGPPHEGESNFSSLEVSKIQKPKRKYTFKKRLMKVDGNSLLKSKGKKILKEVRVLSYKSLNTGESALPLDGNVDDKVPEEELKKPERRKRPYVRRNRKIDENSPAVAKPKKRKKKEVEDGIQREEAIGFLCTDCGLSFDSALSREDHRQDCRNIAFEMSLMAEDYLYECPYCQLTFALKGTHRKHIASCRISRSRKNGHRKRRTTTNLQRSAVIKVESPPPSPVSNSSTKPSSNLSEQELVRETSPNVSRIGNRLVSHCQNQTGVKEIASLLLEYKLCTNGMRSLLTSASSLQEADTVIQLNKEQASVPSYSQGFSYLILQDIIEQAKLQTLSQELINAALLFKKSDDEVLNCLSLTINTSKSELLKALSNLEELLKEADELESAVKRQQMLLTMKETFQADTGS